MLFEGRFGNAFPRSYDVGPDGRFLMLQAIPDLNNERARKMFPSTVRVVLNWSEELQRLLASPR